MNSNKFYFNYKINNSETNYLVKNLNIALDLDSTLIFCTCSNNFDFELLTSFKLNNCTIYIYERPYLKEFFDFIKNNFNIYIYTNGNYEYSEILSTHLKHKFNIHICEIICRINTNKQQNKLLEYFSNSNITNNNTIIIDDIQYIWKNSFLNVINIKPFDLNNFYFNDNSIFNEIDLFILIEFITSFLESHEKNNNFNFQFEVNNLNNKYKNISQTTFNKFIDILNKKNDLLTDSDDSNSLYDSSDYILNNYFKKIKV